MLNEKAEAFNPILTRTCSRGGFLSPASSRRTPFRSVHCFDPSSNRRGTPPFSNERLQMRRGAISAILDGFAEAMSRLASGDPLAWTIVGVCVLVFVPIVIAASAMYFKHKKEDEKGRGKIRWKEGKGTRK